jgi:N-acetylglucosamine malate deacetylase 1
MNAYKSEVSKHPFSRSEINIRALATYRNVTFGYDYVGSFMFMKGQK